jgi:hypothetical protein
MMRVKKILFILVLLIISYFLFLLSIYYYKIYNNFDKKDYKRVKLVDVEYDPDIGVIPQKTFIVNFNNKKYTLYIPSEYWKDVESEDIVTVIYSNEYDELFYFRADKKIKIEFISASFLFIVILGCSIYWIYKF